MGKALDYLRHLRTESARFAEVMRTAPADARVPTCPDWDSDDLLWHLGEVQWFWATIVRENPSDPSSVQHPDRPAGRDGLLGFFEESTHALQQALTDTDPGDHRWTWADEQTVGFIRRRQAHEALVHRVDAELTADVERQAMDAALCADGVDEALRVMFAEAPDWGRVDPEPGATLRVRADDTADSWLVTLARFTGTDPDGKSYDEPVIEVAAADSGDASVAVVTGAAADLDCWVWGRPIEAPLDRVGDERVLARFQEMVDRGID